MALRLLIAAGVVAGVQSEPSPWMNKSKSVDERTELLLREMTVAEKVSQLGYSENCEKLGLQVGGCHVVTYNMTWRNGLQSKIMNASRLNIPASFYAETTHSSGVDGGTIFPMPVSQGATWNRTLVRLIGAANALELRSCGGDHGLSPILQVCTDPRFGRMEENFAEDPKLVQDYGVAALTGLQGTDGLGGASAYLGSPNVSVTSQAKHFAVYGAGSKDGYTPLGGGPTIRSIFDIYLRPWREYARMGGRGVMASHNMIDWTPSHANKEMLTDVLRDKFGLKGGYIGSDDGNVEQLHETYGIVDSNDEAAALAMESGVDQDMPGSSYLNSAPLVYSGVISNDTFNRAVGNVLRKKFAAGIFDAPFANPDMKKYITSPEHVRLAHEAAAQGCTLLKNDNNVLPINPTSIKKVAVIGPFGGCPKNTTSNHVMRGCPARIAMVGGYTADPLPGQEYRSVTVEEGFKARGYDVTYTQGSDGGRGGPPPASASDAVQAAKDADLVVAVVGTMACGCCNRCGNGEAGDRTSLVLEGGQLDLLDKLSDVTSKLVVVLVHGRPVTFGDFNQSNYLLGKIPSVLSSWRSGEQGGTAIADIILGSVNPSGKLAQAWPRSAGYIHTPVNPWYQIHTDMGTGTYYPNGDGTPMTPLFPFAHGLSYTTFKFSNLIIDSSNVPSVGFNGTRLATTFVNVSVEVTNTGSMGGATAVIVIYRKHTYKVVRYLRELGAFDKVYLNAGESKRVNIPLALSDLAYFNKNVQYGTGIQGAYVVDGGKYNIEVGDCVSMQGVYNDQSCVTQDGSFLLAGNRTAYGIYM